MTITTKLTEKEFINASLTLLFGKVFYKILVGIACFFLLFSLLMWTMSDVKADVQPIITAVLIISVLPVSTYFTAKKLYQTNPQMREAVTYTFTDSEFTITGETYSSKLPWSSIHKVTQTKRWLLIWSTKMKASPIPIKELWGGQIADLKEILDRNKVKNNLNPSK